MKFTLTSYVNITYNGCPVNELLAQDAHMLVYITTLHHTLNDIFPQVRSLHTVQVIEMKDKVDTGAQVVNYTMVNM